MRYAGALCPRCLKGINNEVQIEGHEDTKKRQLKDMVVTVYAMNVYFIK